MRSLLTWAEGIRALIAGGCLVGGSLASSPALAANRSMDGTGNHPSDLGAANTPLYRHAPPAYPDDASGTTMIDWPTRPNPRDISNALIDQGGVSIINDRSLTDFVWQWGQFLDHDIDLTGGDPANGTAYITINDSLDPLGPNPIPFNRSNYASWTGTTGNPREQMNAITAFIDGSNVYGSDDTRADWLRTGDKGKLKSSTGNLLPFNDGTQPNDGGPGTNMFVAGDVRSNEQAGLTSMHTLFMREHNRLADIIDTTFTGLPVDPTDRDEEIYQTARKIVAAEIQAITYNEFLPALLGNTAPKSGDYVYDNTVNPSIANEFSTALYRFGHSMLSANLQLVDNTGAPTGELPLRDAFFNPDFLATDPSNLDLLLKGLANQQAQEIDANMVEDVRSFLFGPPGAGGLDLASLNIQRGRDHGLPDYNALRAAYGLIPVDSFDDITSDTGVQSILQSLYGTVDNIDPWVGGLAEDHVPGSSVGELVKAVLGDQFTRLRDGDAFFYVADTDLQQTDVLSIIDVNSVTLADIIRSNTGITQIQNNVFLMENAVIVPIPAAAWAGTGLLGLIAMVRIRGFARNELS